MINKLFQNKKYEPLRHMESFTQDMFNRIIDFQEKQHGAWNPDLSFDQRITGLPLHYLIFSCADRDPSRYGPTVAPYYPLRVELYKIANYIKQLDAQPTLCDFYPNNGFVGSLIAREGIDTVGLKNHNQLPNQIGEFYDATCYQFSDNDFLNQACDAVLVSWPRPEVNPTLEILQKGPKLIVYIYTEHKNEETGQRQTGSDDMFDALAEDYYLLDHWTIARTKNILHEVWPDMTPNIEEHRHVRIYASNASPRLDKDTTTEIQPVYDWEKDLQMAELALEGKREIEMRQMMM